LPRGKPSRRLSADKIARGDALRGRLYVSEVFSVEERGAINTRRLAQWQHAGAAPGRRQQLMLLIGEVKEIVPARCRYKAVIKSARPASRPSPRCR
jgi:Protein of unknown function (DUF1173)